MYPKWPNAVPTKNPPTNHGVLFVIDTTYVITYNTFIMITVSATTARNNLYDLLEEASSGKKIAITNKGETKAVLISAEELISWEATLEVLSDKRLMKDIKKGLDAIKKGEVVPWEEVKKKAGL